MMMRAGLTFARPAYGIHAVTVGNREVPVIEEPVLATPFGALLRFRKDIDTVQPKVLVLAPLSGHFATLLRGTIRTLLPDHDVYITDWHNARDVPLSEGRFGFDDYVDHVVRFLETIGEGAHLMAVCQPAVQALAATAVMAHTRNPAQPRSMTLMAGPVDCRVSPTSVNALATSKPIEWFEQNLIETVPGRHKGAGRRVYPGFMQVAAFVSMNARRHSDAHTDLFWHYVDGSADKAQAIESFYDEYFAVLDLTAEFYLETVKTVFQDYTLARNQLTYRGEPIDMGAIRRTALMTVEGERDDICAVGQTMAAHDLCSGVPRHMKSHHLQAGVGHYGVFSGRKWEAQTYPLVRNFIASHA
ncbi:polyhydroxyalkanoate depolymerase, intracellular [Methylorubrum populi BJ001]|uniref:Polyhydroxyalkanoate depolymerase, intracellular n=2 Tax=Methylorubrum populi TaxID=223967 RepID=B1ZBK1_METPB|nr:polyhydroxyalkanoate depolymerase, intracellular [Methylorubrum populi BJ001]